MKALLPTEGCFIKHSPSVSVVASFEEMSLKRELLRGIFAYGYEEPSSIQQRAIIPISLGQNVIAQAQSGTGKTAAFSIGLLQRIDCEKQTTQALVVSPTRELALQSNAVLSGLGIHLSVHPYACVGGSKIGEGLKRLEGRPRVVSGTPGRVLDMLHRGHLRAKDIRVLILDEVDEILSKGLKERIESIYGLLGSETQLVLISATLPQAVFGLVQLLMKEPPIQILVPRDELTLAGIKQHHVLVEEEKWKFDALCAIYSSVLVSQAVIFCSTRRKVVWLFKKMQSAGFVVSVVHGEMAQAARTQTLGEFREGKTRVLISTDIWSRGIDVQQVTLVVNFDLPQSSEIYLHRIGRSGRFGRTGLAVNLVTARELKDLGSIEKHYKIKITALPRNFSELSL